MILVTFEQTRDTFKQLFCRSGYDTYVSQISYHNVSGVSTEVAVWDKAGFPTFLLELQTAATGGVSLERLTQRHYSSYQARSQSTQKKI